MKRFVRSVAVDSGPTAFAVAGVAERGGDCVLLETRSPSSDRATSPAGWSCVGWDPLHTIRIPTGAGGWKRLERDCAWLGVDSERRTSGTERRPFRSGLLGFFGYEFLQESASTVAGRRHERSEGARAVDGCGFIAPSLVYTYEEGARRGVLSATGLGETDEGAARHAAQALERGLAMLAPLRGERGERGCGDAPSGAERLARPPITEARIRAAGFLPHVPRAAYLHAVAEVRRRILEGDAFEVCFTAGFEGPPLPASESFSLYRVLREVSPAPFSAWLRIGDLAIASASPERLLRIERTSDGGRRAETRPIKGTRPRGATAEEDDALARDLGNSEKDRAENVMIVDLARNDLGKFAELGSVRVPALFAVERHAFTHQLVSTVEARVSEVRSSLACIRDVVPAGSMTGAPKVEAMRIARELEPVARGPYAGSIGYLADDGEVDLSVVIRSFVLGPRSTWFHVGGAVTADSEPESEHQEALDKAHGLVAAWEIFRRRP